MINNKFFLIFIIVTLTASSAAFAGDCGLRKVKFGINQEDLKKGFGFEALEVASEGKAIINVGGPEICKDLPENSKVSFEMVDNHLAQMVILNNEKGQLLKFAKEVFGDPDNKKRQKKVKNPNKTPIAMWKKQGEYYVAYSEFTKGKQDIEKLVISSVKQKQPAIKEER